MGLEIHTAPENEQSERTETILGIPRYWENFVLSILLVLILPLVPLLLEYVALTYLRSETLFITTSMYALSVGVTSRSKVIFGGGLIAGVLFAAIYGMAVEATPTNHHSWLPPIFAAITIFSVLVAHAVERFQRQVQKRQPFLEFLP